MKMSVELRKSCPITMSIYDSKNNSFNTFVITSLSILSKHIWIISLIASVYVWIQCISSLFLNLIFLSNNYQMNNPSCVKQFMNTRFELIYVLFTRQKLEIYTCTCIGLLDNNCYNIKNISSFNFLIIKKVKKTLKKCSNLHFFFPFRKNYDMIKL